MNVDREPSSRGFDSDKIKEKIKKDNLKVVMSLALLGAGMIGGFIYLDSLEAASAREEIIKGGGFDLKKLDENFLESI